MVLFYENESKYFALLTSLINSRKSFTSRELEEQMEIYCHETDDYLMLNNLFNEGYKVKESGQKVNVFFKCEQDTYIKNEALEHIPVSFTTIELQAAQNMARNANAVRFLKPETIDKLAKTLEEIPAGWSEEDFIRRRMYKIDGNPETEIPADVKLIADAIRKGTSIIYDYDTRGKKHLADREAFPVRILYSNIDSLFSVDVYNVSHNEKGHFTTLRLIDISNLQLGNKRIPIDIQQKYLQNRKSEMRTVKLSVKPKNNTVERCFMMFSYLNRTATYDKENNEYTLEIEYSKDDENEMKRNLMSMGSAVTVLEPAKLREEIVERIRKTVANYADETEDAGAK